MKNYVIARFFSVLGLQVLSTAFIIVALSAGADAWFIGQLGMAATIASLFSTFPIGHFVDRLSRGKSMVLSQSLTIGFALLLLVLPATWVQNRSHLLVLVPILALVRNFRSIAQYALFGEVVKAEKDASAWLLTSTLAWQSSFLVGPILTGLLFTTVGVRGAYLAAVFALTAGLVLQLSLLSKVTAIAATPSSFLGSVVAVKGRFQRNLKMTAAMALDFGVILFAGSTAILPFLHGHTATPVQVGLLRAAMPFGTIVSTLVLLKRRPTAGWSQGLFTSAIGFGVCNLLLAFSPHIAVSLVLLAGAGGFDGVSLFIRDSLMQFDSPDHLRGRIYAFNNFLVNASDELSEWESGLSSHLLGIRGALLAGAGATFALAAGFRAAVQSHHLGKGTKPVKSHHGFHAPLGTPTAVISLWSNSHSITQPIARPISQRNKNENLLKTSL